MEEHAARNRRRTALVVLAWLGAAGAAGYLVGLAAGSGAVGLLVALLAAGGWAAWSYREADDLVLASLGARRTRPEEEPRLHNIAEGLLRAAGVPMPALLVLEEQAPNALAVGRHPARASIVVTRGLLETLNRVELEGVVAHELAHVRDLDTLPATFAAALLGGPVLLSARAGPAPDRGADPPASRRGSLPGRLVAGAIQVAVPPGRELAADERAALLTRYPPGLASALRKLDARSEPLRAANAATAHLWLVRPAGEDLEAGRFPTHPPVAQRVEALQEM